MIKPLPDAALVPINFIGVARLSYQFGLPRAILGRTRLGHGDFAVAATAKTQGERSKSDRVCCGKLWLIRGFVRLQLRGGSPRRSRGGGECLMRVNVCVFNGAVEGSNSSKRGARRHRLGGDLH